MNVGSKIFMLVEEMPIGIVSVTDSLIEDLYILPDKQNMGYGTKLLQFAVSQCIGTPTLWILENNINAERLYLRMGFEKTGRKNTISNGLDEIELEDGTHKQVKFLSLTPAGMSFDPDAPDAE